MTPKQLYELAQSTFQKRSSLLNLWQSIADNFFVERADFTVSRSLGSEFADHLMTSYPLLARRDLGDQIGTMLRPTAKNWFKTVTSDLRREDNESNQWLQWTANTQRRAMYDRAAMFNRANKEGDHDFAAFGQRVISVEEFHPPEIRGMTYPGPNLLYRCWHLRDVAWMENTQGEVGPVFVKWKPQARVLNKLFASKVHRNIVQLAEKKPFEEVECMRMVVEGEMYDDKPNGRPYWSIYYDCQNHQLIEAIPTFNKTFSVSRWQTVSGSQYAFSPATVAALPDARLLQSMMHTLLEAGEKLVNPPMVATQDAVRSDIAVFAGGVTWVDMEYDEKLGEALRPLSLDHRGMPMGIEMYKAAQQMIAQAFYLNKLTLPERAPEMTAYEVGQRIQEYIRGALPLFEPMESECNGQICDLTFDILMRNGAFGSPHDMPAKLRGADIQFRFESPLHDAIEQQKGQKFIESHGLLSQAAALDPTIGNLVDAKVAMRDVLNSIGMPAAWIRSEAAVDELDDQQNQQAALSPEAIAQASESLQNVQRGTQAAVDLKGLAGKLAA